MNAKSSERVIEWFYIPTGKVKHAVLARSVTAECGMGTWSREFWHGTGSQREYEEVARRPACRRCLRLGYRP